MATTESRNTLGGRLTLLAPSTLSTAQRHMYDRLTANQLVSADSVDFQTATPDGRLIGPFNAALVSPGPSAGLVDFMEAEATSTSLDARVRQVVILAVGAVWGSSYELYAHAAEARRAGLNEEIIEALAAGRLPAGLTDREVLAARFAQQLTANRHVDADLYAEAEQTYGQASLVDLVLLVGYYQTICGVLNAFEIPSP